MNDITRLEQEGEIGLICLSKPPVNALGVALRTSVYQNLQELLADVRIKAIVLYGEGRFFSAGADIKDFGRSSENPTLPDVLKALNDSPKPTVAALHGVAFGGALELALSCHLRVGILGLKVGLPEVKLGLLPGAGGSQRLPRLTGMATALEMICSGRHVRADEALASGIISRLENDTARNAGMRAARDILAGALVATPTDNLSVARDEAALAAARKTYAGKLNAPMKAIDAIEAAALPIDEGLSKERAFFMDLMQGTERVGLVHAFFAERATAKIPEAEADIRDIACVGVVGGGTMGVGIATSILLAGLPVTLIETAPERVSLAKRNVEKNLAGALKRGKLTEKNHAEALVNLSASADLEALASSDLVIEAIFEDLEAKIKVFRDLDRICKAGAVLATNTSYLSVATIAETTHRPQDVIGMHFFSPAHIMRLIEVVVGEQTGPDTVRTVFALVRKLGKVPVRAADCDGFIGNRILTQYRKAADYLLLDGAEFPEIDAALEGFGFAMGPFAVNDLAGLDVAKATRDRKALTRPKQERYSCVADLICDQGWHGRKTGQGYYLYENGKSLGANSGAMDIVAAQRHALGLAKLSFSHDDIVARSLTAMIAEAVRVLDEGIALRPVDIDAVELFGYGFPRHRGGPMHQADLIGPAELIRRIECYAQDDAYFWQVPQLLRDMLRSGRSFADLNQ